MTAMLNDADLHGLVDGHLDADRRAEILRRAAMSPRDRALVEEWQDQTDLIRVAFAGVEREPLPRALDVRTRPLLRAVEGATREAVSTVDARQRPSTSWRSSLWPRSAVTIATLAAMIAGLAGSWYIAKLPAEGDRQIPLRAAPDDERMVADRTIASLAFAEADASVERADRASPPVIGSIPDLSTSGFAFVDAYARGLAPRSIVFRYRSADGDRLAIGALRSVGIDSGPLARGSGFVWRKSHVTYAIFGTLPADRLRAIAARVRSADAAD